MGSVEQNNDNFKTMTREKMFSPIKLSLPKLYQGKNLTGIARLICDLVVGIHTNVQQWNSLHIQGINYLKNIIEEKHEKNYSELLQDLCDKLENVCDNLDGIVQNLNQIKCQLIAIRDYQTLQKITDKFFITWPINKFGEIAEIIYKAYHKELILKRNILENIAHDNIESWKVYFAAWVHQPSLSENLIILLDLLKLVTGGSTCSNL